MRSQPTHYEIAARAIALARAQRVRARVARGERCGAIRIEKRREEREEERGEETQEEREEQREKKREAAKRG